ncbi:MAG: amidohydrolase family protein [Flammeovirgaceae bacterium]|nr:MAG: amidohydrolase family protein [Flammeovirgaceae bacterium]
MKKIFTTILMLLAGVYTFAQAPVPAKAQDKPIALTGGVAHLGNGQVIENSVIAFDKGKLTIVTSASANPNLTGYEVIRIDGKHVYPGFILPNSQVGLQEVTSIRAMNDYQERGDMNPNVRSLISYNTDSEFIPTFRFNGVLLAETTPTGGTISGSSSVMEMEGWNWEDAVHSADIGIHMNWPALMRRQFDFNTFSFSESPNADYEKQVTALVQFFAEAQAYGKLASKETNLKFDALQGLFDGSKVLFIHATMPKEIVESIRFAQRSGVQRITLLSGQGAYWVADFLKENNIPVILPDTHSLPDRTDDDIDMPFKLPYLLTQAGVQVSLSCTGALHGGRNLAFFAGTAAAYGLGKEDALKAITSNTAKALGIDKRVGTLEVGKDATLFVSSGDALDMRTNNLSHAFISGKQVTLPGNQQELYERFSKKYGQMR